MTCKEAANSMRRIADAFDRIHPSVQNAEIGDPKPALKDDFAVGAAVLLCYIRDLVTAGSRETYDRPTLLVMLEAISRDAEIFPCGVAQIMWGMENGEEEESE